MALDVLEQPVFITPRSISSKQRLAAVAYRQLEEKGEYVYPTLIALFAIAIVTPLVTPLGGVHVQCHLGLFDNADKPMHSVYLQPWGASLIPGYNPAFL
jgi:hypothetical protein